MPHILGPEHDFLPTGGQAIQGSSRRDDGKAKAGPGVKGEDEIAAAPWSTGTPPVLENNPFSYAESML